MILNIVVKSRPRDRFAPTTSKSKRSISISQFGKPSATAAVSHNVLNLLNKRKLRPSDVVVDLANAAEAVYVADHFVSRKKQGYYNWSRQFRLFLPVADVRKWENMKTNFEKMLRFLTGDMWEVQFRRRRPSSEKAATRRLKFDCVCLFSGGADSFIGAVDLLETEHNVALVSHHKKGSQEANAKNQLFKLLQSRYSPGRVDLFDFYVQPNQKHPLAEVERSSRSRSFLFISFGILIANSIRRTLPVYVPENGFISLNVPFTESRLGSLSTRTTHPFFISLFKELLHGLGIEHPLVNPYQFATKGEMILKSKNRRLVSRNFGTTVSCAHPSNINIRKGKTNPPNNCGYCTPCLIRRSAAYHAGVIDDRYARDVVARPPDATTPIGRDYRAFRIAIARFLRPQPRRMMQVLSSGPLPFENAEELQGYISVYERGMEEILDFLRIGKRK